MKNSLKSIPKGAKVGFKISLSSASYNDVFDKVFYKTNLVIILARNRPSSELRLRAKIMTKFVLEKTLSNTSLYDAELRDILNPTLAFFN